MSNPTPSREECADFLWGDPEAALDMTNQEAVALIRASAQHLRESAERERANQFDYCALMERYDALAERDRGLVEALRSLKPLRDALEADFGGDTMKAWPDGDAVAAGVKGDCALTFGMIRALDAALARLDADTPKPVDPHLQWHVDALQRALIELADLEATEDFAVAMADVTARIMPEPYRPVDADEPEGRKCACCDCPATRPHPGFTISEQRERKTQVWLCDICGPVDAGGEQPTVCSESKTLPERRCTVCRMRDDNHVGPCHDGDCDGVMEVVEPCGSCDPNQPGTAWECPFTGQRHRSRGESGSRMPIPCPRCRPGGEQPEPPVQCADCDRLAHLCPVHGKPAAPEEQA